ncbi:MAG: endonuclease/exonuclease/phosphatase family protein, partial [Methylocystis sp.]|nr:endonuclease/exonuclease/phosphatase family protein [Methylocystis sp.]
MTSLRLATFNIENLDYSRAHADAFVRRARLLRSLLETLDADLLCLQEVGAQKPHKHSPREYIALDMLLRGTRYAGFCRALSLRPGADAPADVHNLAIISRWPIRTRRQLYHDIVAPWSWTPPRDGDAAPPPVDISWDRPALYAG